LTNLAKIQEFTKFTSGFNPGFCGINEEWSRQKAFPNFYHVLVTASATIVRHSFDSSKTVNKQDLCICCKGCTFHDGCKQGIDQQIFNRKSMSRKITHPQF